MSLVRPITRRDIKGPALYGPIRDDYRNRVIELKRPRRVLIGDRVSLVFENRHTLTLQIEEICRAENLTRDDQIEAEIAVYNELMPTETSLSATLFIELPPEADAYVALKRAGRARRARRAARRAARDPRRVRARALDRRQDLGRAVHALSADAPRRAPRCTPPGTAIAVEIDHPNYRHRVACPEATRASLAADYA